MAKLTQEQIDSIPGLRAAQKNGDVVFLNLDTLDTSPTITAGFDDESIAAMNADALRNQLQDVNREEENLTSMLTGVRRRRNDINAILARKTELAKNGICN